MKNTNNHRLTVLSDPFLENSASMRDASFRIPEPFRVIPHH